MKITFNSKRVLILLLIVVAAGFLVARTFFESKRYYHKAVDSLDAGDTHMSAVYFGRAAGWYLPGNPYVSRSLDGLFKIADLAKDSGDLDLALSAGYTLRGAIYGSRWLATPHKKRLSACNRLIADITVMRKPEADREKVLKELETPLRPKIGWSVVVVLGFFSWVGCAVGFIFRSYNSEGKIVKPKASIGWGAGILLFFMIWILSMLKA